MAEICQSLIGIQQQNLRYRFQVKFLGQMTLSANIKLKFFLNCPKAGVESFQIRSA